MLKKSRRIKKRREIDEIYRIGKKINSESFRLIYLKDPNTGAELSRFAVFVGKKVSKEAHERNRIRRQIYPILKQHNLFKQTDLRLLVVPKPVLNVATSKKLQELSSLLDQI